MLYVSLYYCSPLELSLSALSEIYLTVGLVQYGRSNPVLKQPHSLLFTRFRFYDHLKSLLSTWDWGQVLGAQGTQIEQVAWRERSFYFLRPQNYFIFHYASSNFFNAQKKKKQARKPFCENKVQGISNRKKTRSTLKGIVSTKLFFLWAPLAPFHLADASSFPFDFDWSPFSVSTIATFFAISVS